MLGIRYIPKTGVSSKPERETPTEIPYPEFKAKLFIAPRPISTPKYISLSAKEKDVPLESDSASTEVVSSVSEIATTSASCAKAKKLTNKTSKRAIIFFIFSSL